ncbi:hypothetical protein EVJ50_10265 [Synechococcus sp. RSCCF101]|uniref:hypothetical protein n=1 Tax=Synechococcus sp. RSCCF101 TaxID=2511069 RepID=UPI001244E56B|nr:hypothetical protein [Synechococcus sp. RSCCF101]QEY32550.1 hypothetical protein EVJ50_10265 [Synechococcus sp. RSCCF101]
MSAVSESQPRQDRRLQQDTIRLGERTVYLNPFLYWRRFDANTDRWLREPGQLPEEQIALNRRRFYPELDWDHLSPADQRLRDGAVEMFLKSLELVTTFNPELSSGHLLEVERKMVITKKRAFERWVERALQRREREGLRQRRRFRLEQEGRAWSEWLALGTTRRALVPIVVAMVLAGFAGWWMGVSAQRCSTTPTTAAPLRSGPSAAL